MFHPRPSALRHLLLLHCRDLLRDRDSIDIQFRWGVAVRRTVTMYLNCSGQGPDVGVREDDLERHPRIFDIGIVVSEKSGLRRTFCDSELGSYTPPNFASTYIRCVGSSPTIDTVTLSRATVCDGC